MKARRWLSVLLALAMVISMIPVGLTTASASDTETETETETPSNTIYADLVSGGSYTFESTGHLEAEFSFTPESSGTYVFYSPHEAQSSPSCSARLADGSSYLAIGHQVTPKSYGAEDGWELMYAWYFEVEAGVEYTILLDTDASDTVTVYLDAAESATSLELDGSDYETMEIGGNRGLNVYPNSLLAYDEYYEWTCDVEGVVEFHSSSETTWGANHSMTLHALAAGTTTVTVTGYPSGLTDTITITVNAPDGVLSLGSNTTAMNPWESSHFIFTAPEDAEEGTNYVFCVEEWQGLNFEFEGVAGDWYVTLDYTGMYVSLDPGESIVFTVHNGTKYSFETEIYVSAMTEETDPENIGLFTPDQWHVGDNVALYLRMNPGCVLPGDVQWSSSDETVVSIDYGFETGCWFNCHAEGTTTISLTVGNHTYNSTIEVKKGDITLTEGETADITLSYGQDFKILFAPTTSGDYTLYFPVMDNWGCGVRCLDGTWPEHQSFTRGGYGLIQMTLEAGKEYQISLGHYMYGANQTTQVSIAQTMPLEKAVISLGQDVYTAGRNEDVAVSVSIAPIYTEYFDYSVQWDCSGENGYFNGTENEDMTANFYTTGYGDLSVTAILDCGEMTYEASATITVEAPPALVLGVPVEVTSVQDGYVTYSFTPDQSCWYLFRSYGDCNTFGKAYNVTSGGGWSCDDYNGSTNFGVFMWLDAGSTYELYARMNDWSGGATFTIVMEHDTSGDIETLSRTEPTCTEDGSALYYCSNCGYKWEVVLPAGHVYENGECTGCGEEQIYQGQWDTEEGVVSWYFSGKTQILTISGTGAMPDFDHQGAPWYDWRDLIATIVVESGITRIGQYAFEYCEQATSVSIADTVTSIGNYAFEFCRNLTQVTLSENVTELGYKVFSNSGLTSFTLPLSITGLQGNPFSGCEDLTGIYVADGHTAYTSVDGVLYTADMSTIVAVPASVTSYVIPAGVTTVGEGAFYDCFYLTSVVIPEGVTRLELDAFVSCYKLNGVVLPSTLTYIGESAFRNCESLTEIVIPSGVTEISTNAFANCYQLKALIIPASVTAIGDWFVGSSGITSVIFEGSKPQFGEYAFGGYYNIIWYPLGDSTWNGIADTYLGGNPTWLGYDGPVIYQQSPETVTCYTGGTANLYVTVYGTGLTYQWQIWDETGSQWVDMEGETQSTLSPSTTDYIDSQYRCVVTDGQGSSATSSAITVHVGAPLTPGGSIQTTIEAYGETTLLILVEEDGVYVLNTEVVTDGVYYNGTLINQATNDGYTSYGGGIYVLPAGLYSVSVWNEYDTSGSITLSLSSAPTMELNSTVDGSTTYYYPAAYVLKPDQDVLVSLNWSGDNLGISFYDAATGEWPEDGFMGMYQLQAGGTYVVLLRAYTDYAWYSLSVSTPKELTANESTSMELPYSSTQVFTFTPEKDGYYNRVIYSDLGGYASSMLCSQEYGYEDTLGEGIYYLQGGVTYYFEVTNYYGSTMGLTVTMTGNQTMSANESLSVELAPYGSSLYTLSVETSGYYVFPESGETYVSIVRPVLDGVNWVSGCSYEGAGTVFYLEAGAQYLVTVHNEMSESVTLESSLDMVPVLGMGDTEITMDPGSTTGLYVVTPETGGFHSLSLPRYDGIRASILNSELYHLGVNTCYGEDYLAYVTNLNVGGSYLVVFVNYGEVNTFTASLSECAQPESMNVNWSETTVRTGNCVSGNVRFDPALTGETFVITTSNADVVAVEEINGTNFDLLACSAGTAVITLTTQSGLTASTTITVEDPPTLTLGEETEFTLDAFTSDILWMDTEEAGYYVIALPEYMRVYGMYCDEYGCGTEHSILVDGMRYYYYDLDADTHYVLEVYNTSDSRVTANAMASACEEPSTIVAPETLHIALGTTVTLEAALGSFLEYSAIEWRSEAGTGGAWVTGYVSPGWTVFLYGGQAGTATLYGYCGDVQMIAIDVVIGEPEELPEGGVDVTLDPYSSYAYTFTPGATGWYSVAALPDGMENTFGYCTQTNPETGESLTFISLTEGESYTFNLVNTTGEAISYTLAPALCGTPESARLELVESDGWSMTFHVYFEPFGTFAEGEWSFEGDMNFEGSVGTEAYVYCYSIGTLYYTYGDIELSYRCISAKYAPRIVFCELYNYGEGWFYPDAYENESCGITRLSQQRYVAFLKTYDPETGEWTKTPLDPTTLGHSENLSIVPLSETGETIAPDGQYADYYFVIGSADHVAGEYELTTEYDGGTVSMEVNVSYVGPAFYTDAEAGLDTWLDGTCEIDPEKENIIYLVLDDPDRMLDSVEVYGGSEYATVEVLDERTAKITILCDHAFELELFAGGYGYCYLNLTVPPIPLNLGEVYTMTSVQGGYVYFAFTPAVSCEYLFRSYSSFDTWAQILDENGNQVASNDDYDGSMNFGVVCELEAGKTYYLGARMLGGQGGNVFDVVITHVAGSHLTELDRLDPTCETDGYVTYQCANCGQTWSETLAGGHDFEDGWCTGCGIEEVYTGVCGEDLTWHFSGATCVLTISGTGAMYDFYSETPEWDDLCWNIRMVQVGEGVTTIGAYAFGRFYNLELINLPEGLTAIGEGAFTNCFNLQQVIVPAYESLTLGDAVFMGCGVTDLILASSAPAFSEYTFAEVTDMTVHYPATWSEDVLLQYGSDNGVTWAAMNAPVILDCPAGIFGTAGRVTEISVYAYSAAGEITYQWQRSADSGESWTDLEDTDSILEISVTAADDNCLYRCVLTDSNGTTCTEGTILVVPDGSLKVDETVTIDAAASSDEPGSKILSFIPEKSGWYYVHSAASSIECLVMLADGTAMSSEVGGYWLEEDVLYVFAFANGTTKAVQAVVRGQGELTVDTVYESTLPQYQYHSLAFTVEETGIYVVRGLQTCEFVVVTEGFDSVESFDGRWVDEDYCFRYYLLEEGVTYNLFFMSYASGVGEVSFLVTPGTPAESLDAPESVVGVVGGQMSIDASPADPYGYVENWRWEIVSGKDVIELNSDSYAECQVSFIGVGEAVLQVTGDNLTATVTIVVEDLWTIELDGSDTATVEPGSQLGYVFYAEADGWYSYIFSKNIDWTSVSGYQNNYYYFQVGDLQCITFYASEYVGVKLYLYNVSGETASVTTQVIAAGVPESGVIELNSIGDTWMSLWLNFLPIGSFVEEVIWTSSDENVLSINGSTVNNCWMDILDPEGTATITATWEGGSATYVYARNEAAIETQPESVTAIEGETVYFNVTATGTGLTYQWQYRVNSSSGWSNTGLEGNTTDTLKVSATAARNGYQYRCVVTDQYGNVVCSDAATLTVVVMNVATITEQPKSMIAKEGVTVPFTITATGDGITYQWQYCTGTSGDWASTGLTGNKTATLEVPAALTRNGYQYRCAVTDQYGNVVYSDAASLTVYAVAAITGQPADATVVVGDTASFTVTATGTSLTYQWQFRANSSSGWSNTGLEGSTTDTLKVPATAARNGMQYRCVVTDGFGSVVYSDAATLTTYSALSITGQPTDATAIAGETVYFTVTASGTGLTYQWQYRANSSSGWSSTGLTGNKTATLEVPATTARNGMQYRCVVTDEHGSVVYSNAATLTVTAAAAITGQPADVSAVLGDTATFTVTATGTGLTYQWQFRVSSTSGWANTGLTGNTTATLSVSATAVRNGYQYRCVVTDAAGNVVYSNAATLTTYSALSITGQPADASATAGETVYFTVTASGTGLTYQWQYRANSTSGWSNTGLTGNKTATLEVPATTARNGMQYRCVVTDEHGSVVYSNAATLTVTAAAAITGQPADASATAGETVYFTVTATGTGLTYQWQYRANSTSGWSNTGLTGNKTATLEVPATTARNGMQYRCVVTDASGSVVYSNAATLTVTAAVAITGQPADKTASAGETVYFTVTATGTGLTYQWQYRANSTSGWSNTGLTGNKTATLEVPATTARNGMQYRCVVTDASGSVVYSNAATLTVTAAVAITGQPADKTASAGETVYFTVAATGTGLTYQWQYRANSTSGWSNTGLTGSKTATLEVPATTARNGMQYRCVVTDASGNVVYSNAATLTVTAAVAITGQPGSVTALAGETVYFTVTASGTGLTYQWQYRVNSTSGWSNTGLTGSKTATLEVPATTARNGMQYRCVVTDAAGNVVYSNAATLTVVTSVTITGQPASKTASAGETVHFTVTAVGSGLTYQWQYRAGSAYGWSNTGLTGNKTATLEVPATAARNGMQYRCVVTDANGNVVYSDVVTLTVN